MKDETLRSLAMSLLHYTDPALLFTLEDDSTALVLAIVGLCLLLAALRYCPMLPAFRVRTPAAKCTPMDRVYASIAANLIELELDCRRVQVTRL